MARFLYKGPNAHFQVNNVEIMRDAVYETESETEVAALRARMTTEKGLVELKPREEGKPNEEVTD